MRLLIQKVNHARVTHNGTLIASIDQGLLIYACLQPTDTFTMLARTAKKLRALRLYNDTPITDDHHILILSNFTLAARTKGNRLDYHGAMEKHRTREMFDRFVEMVADVHPKVSKGLFGCVCEIECAVQGPFNFVYDIE